MKTKSIVTLFAASVVGLFLSGCAALIIGGAAGAGTYAYVRGEMKSTESAALDRVWSATRAAMKDLQFTVTTEQKDSLQGHLVARTASDKKIDIQLEKISDTSTEVRIRVGTFGDEDLSHLILEKIKKRL